MARSAPLAVFAWVALTAAGAACGSDGTSPESGTSTTTAQATSSTATETTTSTAVTTTEPASVTMAGQTVTTARLRAIATGLCQAALEAPGDLAAAEKTFQSKSHDGLHLIARGLEDIDRTAAAALLEAKQKVEADFSKNVSGPQVAADLRHLADVNRSSLSRFNVSVDACQAM